MAGRIATKAYCNSIAGTSVFTSNLNECPTYNEIIGTGVLTVSGSHSGNQLVLQSEISKIAIAKVKFGFVTNNPNPSYTVEMNAFKVISDTGDYITYDTVLHLNSNSWSGPSGRLFKTYYLDELSGNSVSSSGEILVNGFPVEQNWTPVSDGVINMGLLIDVDGKGGGGIIK